MTVSTAAALLTMMHERLSDLLLPPVKWDVLTIQGPTQAAIAVPLPILLIQLPSLIDRVLIKLRTVESGVNSVKGFLLAMLYVLSYFIIKYKVALSKISLLEYWPVR